MKGLKHPRSAAAQGGAVAQRVERWTCDQQVVGSYLTYGWENRNMDARVSTADDPSFSLK